MFTAIANRIRSQAGQAQLTITAFMAVAVLVVAAFATNTVAEVAPVKASPQAQARSLLAYAGYTANQIAAAHGGSYDRVGLLNLHKVGLVPFARSSTRPWVAAASGRGRTFEITVKAEPAGASFTLSRSADGTTRVSRS